MINCLESNFAVKNKYPQIIVAYRDKNNNPRFERESSTRKKNSQRLRYSIKMIMIVHVPDVSTMRQDPFNEYPFTIHRTTVVPMLYHPLFKVASIPNTKNVQRILNGWLHDLQKYFSTISYIFLALFFLFFFWFFFVFFLFFLFYLIFSKY